MGRYENRVRGKKTLESKKEHVRLEGKSGWYVQLLIRAGYELAKRCE
jgi:hypothetical protein